MQKEENEDKNVDKNNKEKSNKIESTPHELSKANEIKEKSKNKLSFLVLTLTISFSIFPNLALTFFFKDTLKLTPSQISLIYSIYVIPDIIQPLFGLISDFFPICGYRRKIYIILSGLIQAVNWYFLPYLKSKFLSIIDTTIAFTFLTFSCILLDAINIESSQKSGKKINKFSTFSLIKNIGMVVCAIIRSYAIQSFSIENIFKINGLISFFNIIGGFLYNEKIFINNKTYNYSKLSEDEDKNNKNIEKEIISFSNLIKFINNKEVLIPLIYIFFFSCVPSYYQTAFYYLSNIKNFSKGDIGKMTLLLFFNRMIISYIYKNYLKNTNTKLIITLSSLITFLGSFIFYVWSKYIINYKYIAFISISIYSSFGSLGLMPLFGLAFVISPEKYEGSVYSLFSSSASIGACLSLLLSSFLASIFKINGSNFNHFHEMILFNSFLILIPVIPLFFIPGKYLTHFNNESVQEVKIEMKDEQ